MMDRYGKRIIILYNDENVVEGKPFGSFAPPTINRKLHINEFIRFQNLWGFINAPTFRQISLAVHLKFFLVYPSDSQLIWPSWRKFSTVNLQSNELNEYVRKIFSQKFENSPKNEPWVIDGIQGVDVSYVSSLFVHRILGLYGNKIIYSLLQIEFYGCSFRHLSSSYHHLVTAQISSTKYLRMQ